jgi:hypothetical protein
MHNNIGPDPVFNFFKRISSSEVIKECFTYKVIIENEIQLEFVTNIKETDSSFDNFVVLETKRPIYLKKYTAQQLNNILRAYESFDKIEVGNVYLESDKFVVFKSILYCEPQYYEEMLEELIRIHLEAHKIPV